MFRILVFFMLLGFAGKSYAQEAASTKPKPVQVQTPDKTKKVGISSASRKNNLPVQVPSNAGNSSVQKGKTGVPNGSHPTRANVRVPKARPSNPIVRPNTMPRPPRTKPPGG